VSIGATGSAAAPDDGTRTDLTALVDRRLRRYAALWEGAAAKLSTGSYHADDLVDDWFRWVGYVAQDAATAATVILGAGGQDRAPDRG
jgi:hypothetical protein